MTEYNKIPTLFERNPETKKLIIGNYSDPTIKFCKDLTWVFTEKIDGTNTQIYWDGHRVQFFGRTENSQMPNVLYNRLSELFGGEANEQLFEQKFGETPVSLFGEGYGPKIQNGGLYRNDVDFILFDVMINGNYQPRESVENIAEYFNIQTVPILFEGTLDDGVRYITEEPQKTSTIAQNGAKMEGIVGRCKEELRTRTGKRLIVKIKYKDFE